MFGQEILVSTVDYTPNKMIWKDMISVQWEKSRENFEKICPFLQTGDLFDDLRNIVLILKK